MIKEKSCGAVIFNEDMTKVLLIKHNRGHISFPKGHQENNETDKETALREVKEETGINIEIISEKSFHVSYSPNKDKNYKDVYYYIGKIIGGKINPQLEEISECFWINREEATKLITYDNDKKILLDILKEIN